MADINRTTNSMALPSDISSEIIQKTQEQSAIMRLARRIPLPGNGATIPVISADPTAEWVAETGVKPVSNATVGTKLMSAYKMAVIETFSEEFVRDMRSLYDALIGRLPLERPGRVQRILRQRASGHSIDARSRIRHAGMAPRGD